jgi:hypothetical protein
LDQMRNAPRFFVVRSSVAETARGPAANLVVVQKWFEELKPLVPLQ